MKKNITKFIILLALSFFPLGSDVYGADTASASSNNLTQEETYLDGYSETSQDEVVDVFSSGQTNLYITQSDVDLMAKLVYAESRGEPFEGKVAVASVVLNRVLDYNFPNSIRDVIFQPNAFSCVYQNNIVAYPDKNCYDAVYSALSGVDPTNEALYFYNPATATCSWMKTTKKSDLRSIGHHVFFKQ